jgi:hypothetical protein
MRSTTPLRPQIDLVPSIQNLSARPTSSEKLKISYYENEIPPLVQTEMEGLYQNTFSSTAAEHVNSLNTSTYVVYNGASPVTIFLFRREKNRVKVLNGAIKITAEEIERFANFIFVQFESVKVISFQSIQADGSALLFPHQQFNASEDIVLTLPDTAEAYLGSLGKSTRKYIKYHLNRPKRHFPTYTFKIYEKDEIDEQLIHDIIDFNTARMGDKNKISTIDQRHRNWMLKTARTYGFVGVTVIDGRVCAGVFCSRIGANYFMHIIAHDPAYNDFRLGTLCCYMTICETIARAGKEFHFLWGDGDYKYRLLGVKRDLDNLTVYRSRTQYFFNLGLVLKNASADRIRRLKFSLEKNANSNTFSARLTYKFLNVLHAAKRLECFVKYGVRNRRPTKFD